MKKVFKNIMAIDASFALHRSMAVEELNNLTNDKGEKTGGVFGTMRSIGWMMQNSNFLPVLCWDHGLAQRRLDTYPDYKGNLSKQIDYKSQDLAVRMLDGTLTEDDYKESQDVILAAKEKVAQIMENRKTYGSNTSPDEFYIQYRRQRSIIIDICNSLGIPSLFYKGYEGDDLMTYLTRLSEKSVVVTDDKDLIQLLSPVTDINRVMQKQYLKYDEYLKDNGLLSIREMIIHKAIIGDSSDKIPSVTSGEERKYSCGSTTAWKIARVIIENDEIPEKYLEALELCPKDRNKISGFIHNHDKFLRNMELVDLSRVQDDSEIYDKMVADIKSVAGKCNLMTSLAKLKEQGIIKLDVNGIISKVMMASTNYLAEEW